MQFFDKLDHPLAIIASLFTLFILPNYKRNSNDYKFNLIKTPRKWRLNFPYLIKS